MTSNDSDLLSRLQAGEPLAQRELFQRCQQRLRPFFSRKLPNFSDVEDCVSEVITRALEGIRNGQQPQVLDAWISGVAHHVLKERYTQNRRRDAREIPADLPQGPTDPRLELEPTAQPDEDLPDLPSDWEFLLGKRELWAIVRAAIDGINPKLQPIMRTHYELSVERNHTVVGAELADALQMPRESVDRQLHRARRSTLEAIAALVLARTGRDNCPQLAQQLDTILSAEQQRASQNLLLSPDQSTAIANHITGCPTCGPRAKEAREYSKWALPAVLPLTHDDEEWRRTALASSSRADSSPTAPASPALGLPSAPAAAAVSHETAAVDGLVERIRVAVTSAIARIPGMNTAMQFAQQDPDAFRRIAGAVAGGVALIAALVVATATIGGGSSQAAPTPPNTVPGGSTPGGSTPAPGVPGANPGAPGAPSANPGAPSANPGAPSANPGAPSANPGAPGANPGSPDVPGADPGVPGASPGLPGADPGGPGSPPSATADISFDASALSYPNLAISNMSEWWDVRQVKTLRLRPGQYTLVTIGPTATRFTVTQAGRVDYDPSLDGVLSGRGSSTLVLRGAPVRFDATALSYPNFSISGMAEWWDARQARTLRLLPGSHTVVTPGPTATRITVSQAGRVAYDTSLNGVLSGRDTPTLVLRGAPISFDARASSYSIFAISGVRGGMDARQVHTLQLLPGSHTVVPLNRPGARITVTQAGRVDYDPSLDGALGGRDTATLIIR